jgi:hypothetical protein
MYNSWIIHTVDLYYNIYINSTMSAAANVRPLVTIRRPQNEFSRSAQLRYPQRHPIRPSIHPCQPPPLPLSVKRPFWPPPTVSTYWRRPLSSTVNPIPGHISVRPRQRTLASNYTVTMIKSRNIRSLCSLYYPDVVVVQLTTFRLG